ncbi:DUF222 domain-containing protein [Microbispora sp. NPDC088329]|uniref:HNH endonuclease signature motif containing protein n=1 Tax=Microbispora sp. NPDC088329 TaxID=3154869 RepID=UPI003443EEEC
MDLFGSDPEHSRRSNRVDGNWWDRLTADSPLWSSEGSLARDDSFSGWLPIVESEIRRSGPLDGPSDDSPADDSPADDSGADDSGADDSAVNDSAADVANDPAGDRAPGSGLNGAATASAAGSGGAGAGSAGSAGAGSAGDADDGGQGSGGPGGAGAGDRRSRSSWVLVASLRESAQALALAPVPDDAGVCLAEAEDLLFARDRITSALADRVGRVHRAGQARQHGHASTRCWLRTVGGLSVAGAGRLLTLGVQLARLPRVREAFAGGELSAGVVEAICVATEHLTGEQVGLAEPILLELAGRAGPAEVARAGRYLRAVLDPDGDERDERADYGRRFLRVRPGKGGGLEGEFYLPREAAARLRVLLDAYARPRAEGDDRPLRVRQADALIALLEQKIVAELLVLVNAESLPTDPVTDTATDTATDPAAPAPDQSDDANHPEDPTDTEDSENCENCQDTEDLEDTGTSDAAGPEDANDVSDVDGAGGVDVVDADGRRDDLRDRTETAEPAAPELAEPEPAAPESAAPEFIEPVESFGPAEVVEPALGAPCEAEGTDPIAPGADAADLGDAVGLGQAKGDEAESKQQEGTRSEETRSEEARPEETRSSEFQQSKPRQRTPQQSEPQRSASQQGESRSDRSRWDECRPPDPSFGGTSACHAHAGPRPAGGCRHGLGTPEAHGDVRGGQRRHGLGTCEDHGCDTCGREDHGRRRHGESACGCGGGARRSSSARPGTPPRPPGTEGGTPQRPPGALGSKSGPESGTGPGQGLGALLGRAPGLLLATGQVLPVSGVHRLARTSALVRLVMNADGQVLDMGRKVRLATPAQRRAVFARYATCWIDGCPLPATMCQIDHADNWSTGGLTDLKLLGPACQFHNRDRYQHPERYTRHTTGEDRWAFTYHPTRARRPRE